MHLRGIALLLATLAALASAPAAQAKAPPDTVSAVEARRQMVDSEIVGAGIKDPRVIAAMRATPRHEFVVYKDRPMAYFDMALPIGEGQTISPPFIVAYMTEQLEPKPSDKVLEIGTGSGYQAAVLSPLVKEVYSIEIKEPLGRHAARTLKRLGYTNVFTKIGDGYQGWPDKAPFDKIIVTCSPENVPQALVDQLREGGRLVVPLGQRYQQTLYLFRKQDGKLVSEALRPTLFVPMTGTAEEQRKLKPDPLKPGIVNGSFEELAKEGDLVIPKGWHYVRQAEVVSDKLAPDGERYVRFANQEPGRGSQALQAFAIDGRKVQALDVSVRVKGDRLGPGQNTQQLPMLMIVFYDDKQNVVGDRGIGPWRGSFDWQPEHAVLRVPPKATHAIVRIGLLGGIGELSVDDLHISAKSG
ncbi:MAG TPA: protein-L-isoaspartate(D-aspartate) O-methyltransferase [Pirellulales bacterium]